MWSHERSNRCVTLRLPRSRQQTSERIGLPCVHVAARNRSAGPRTIRAPGTQDVLWMKVGVLEAGTWRSCGMLGHEASVGGMLRRDSRPAVW